MARSMVEKLVWMDCKLAGWTEHWLDLALEVKLVLLKVAMMVELMGMISVET